ncbi:DUF2290 domain-containing protein [Acinetobacter pittii]|uniref:DUF2290 domain-containing protein n=1 Tax=Acinetobacter pittii TaxID=48296 RepID=UPI00197FA795|nr:DUF2290 domain-containing protein [Acinetobacter pittii]MBN6516822.1 DUF2290 domain-containing protein [Acinetobacter pittii]
MNPDSILRQCKEVIDRLVLSGLSTEQSYPSARINTSGDYEIGFKKGIEISSALKNIPYQDIYTSVLEEKSYHVHLIDGGLISFSYIFEKKDDHFVLKKHRLSFYPSPSLPSFEDCPDLYEQDEIFLECTKKNLVKFPIRFDYDPKNHINVSHPASHVTFGQFLNCRIPVSMPVTPRKFILFLLRNFYYSGYVKSKNIFDRKMCNVIPVHSITDEERKISHFIL